MMAETCQPWCDIGVCGQTPKRIRLGFFFGARVTTEDNNFCIRWGGADPPMHGSYVYDDNMAVEYWIDL